MYLEGPEHARVNDVSVFQRFSHGLWGTSRTETPVIESGAGKHRAPSSQRIPVARMGGVLQTTFSDRRVHWQTAA
jgi:hypothetical protein